METKSIIMIANGLVMQATRTSTSKALTCSMENIQGLACEEYRTVNWYFQVYNEN